MGEAIILKDLEEAYPECNKFYKNKEYNVTVNGQKVSIELPCSFLKRGKDKQWLMLKPRNPKAEEFQGAESRITFAALVTKDFDVTRPLEDKQYTLAKKSMFFKISPIDDTKLEKINNEIKITRTVTGYASELWQRVGHKKQGTKIEFVMQRIFGKDLVDVANGLTFLQILESIKSAAEDLHNRIHKQGFVHRDIKLDNMKWLETGHIKHFDFGLSKSIDGANQENDLCGSLPYIAPEIFIACKENQPFDAIKTDIFSLYVSAALLLNIRNHFERRKKPYLQWRKDGTDQTYQTFLKIVKQEINIKWSLIEMETKFLHDKGFKKCMDHEKYQIIALIQKGTHPDPNQRPTLQQGIDDLNKIITAIEERIKFEQKKNSTFVHKTTSMVSRTSSLT